MPDIKGIIVSGVVPKIPYGTTYADVEALVQYRAGQIVLDGDIRSHGQLWCADVNSDFEITDTDVYILSGQTRPNTYYVVPTLLGDVNCDGEVDTTDLLLFKDCLDYVESFLTDYPGSTTDDAYESLLAESGIGITKQGLVNAFYADGDKAYGEYDKPWVGYTNLGTSIKSPNYLSMLTEFDDIYKLVDFPKAFTGIEGANITLYIRVGEEFRNRCDYKWYSKAVGESTFTEVPDSNTSRLVLTNLDVAMNDTIYRVEVWDRNEVVPQYRYYSTRLYVFDTSDILWGDVNDDGVVNILDIALYKDLFKHQIGDINFDGFIDAIDASIILGYYAALSTSQDDIALYDYLMDEGFDTQLAELDAKYGEPLVRALVQQLGDVNGDSLIDAIDSSDVLDAYAQMSAGKDNPIPTLSETDRGIPVFDSNMVRALVKLPPSSVRESSLRQAHIDRILESIKNNKVHLS